MSVGSALAGFFGLVWRILEGVRRVLHLILLLVIFGFILAALHTSIPTVPRSAALVLAPEGELVEQLATDPVRRAFGQASGGPAPETLLKDVIDAIQMAKGVSRGRQARGRSGRFHGSDAVLSRCAGRRGLPRSARPGLCRRLQLLPDVLEGRHRQTRR